jgi:hypothetical protein
MSEMLSYVRERQGNVFPWVPDRSATRMDESGLFCFVGVKRPIMNSETLHRGYLLVTIGMRHPSTHDVRRSYPVRLP